MAWRSGTIMDSRLEFVRLADGGGISMAALCRRFGISRETGYLWLRRYRSDGVGGLTNRSSRPHHSPRQTPPAMEAKILRLRRQRPWGGRKLARRLRDQGVENVPAASTVSAVLRRHGQLTPPPERAPAATRRFERQAPNELWQMDFKGHFALHHGRCHPLNVLDDHSRFLLCLAACADETGETVQAWLTATFRRYGLPQGLLCDNGSPWGGSGAAGFTAIEVWLLRLGVGVHHGRIYHPQTQGKAERLNRSLLAEALAGGRLADLSACQRRFDAFRRIYNQERPHEALGLEVPAQRYRASPRAFPERLAEPRHQPGDLPRRVHHDGAVSLLGRRVKLSQAFAGYDVSFREGGTDGLWRVFFNGFAIAGVDLRAADGAAVVRRVSDRLEMALLD